MGDLTRGYSFTDGKVNDCSSAHLHELVESSALTVAAITGKASLSPDSVADADEFLLHDNSAGGLRRVTFSQIKTDVGAGLTISSIRTYVSQSSHGFSAGDCVRRDTSGIYEKASALHESTTFDASAINVTTNQITKTSHPITNGERVIFKDGGGVPAGLNTGRYYFAKSVDANTIELYYDSALSVIVDITSQGTGTHTLYYRLDDPHQVGLVDSVGLTANAFYLVSQGYLSGVGSFTDGKPRYLSTTAGAMTETPPSVIGSYILPVLIPVSGSASFIAQGIARRIGPNTVSEEAIQADSITLAHLKADPRRRLDTSGKIQTVLSGRVGSATGYGDFMIQGTGLQAILKASLSIPCVISFANGYGKDAQNFTEVLTADLEFNTLPVNRELFLYVERAANGALSAGYTEMIPEYGWVRSIYRNWAMLPRMTGNTAPSGWAASCNSPIVAHDAYMAFDGRGDESSDETYAASNALPAWFKIQLPQAKIVNKYTMSVGAYTADAPTTWEFQGSNNDVDWTTLDSVTGKTWTSGEVYTRFPTNTTAYLYYRVYVTAASDTNDIRIVTLNLFEAISHFFEIPEMTMYYRDGANWVKVNRVFVGDCETSGSVVTDIDTYAINGRFRTQIYRITGTGAVAVEHNLGLDPSQYVVRAWIRANAAWPWWRVNETEYTYDSQFMGLSVAPGYGAGSTLDIGAQTKIKSIQFKRAADGFMHSTRYPNAEASGGGYVTICDVMVDIERAW